jgi:hypothetical protein
MDLTGVFVVILLIVVWARYSSSSSEDEVRYFCESLKNSSLSYSELLSKAKRTDYQVWEYWDNSPGTNEEDIQVAQIFRRWGMAYLNCYVKQKDDQIIDIEFVADWDN